MWAGAWLFLGALCMLWTAAILYLATRDSVDTAGVSSVAGVVGVILWLVWSWGSLELTVVANDGTEVAFSHPELAAVGLMMAWLPGYVALFGPFDILKRVRRGDIDDI